MLSRCVVESSRDWLTGSNEVINPTVLITSCCARGRCLVVGVINGKESWDNWFKLYFNFISDHPIIKAFCYINWDWAKDWKQPEWKNGRIQENEYVRKKFVDELKNKKYIHNQPMDKFMKLVHH